MPQRIQRQRTKGWRMPEGAIYVGRPSKWGSPWRVGERILVDGAGIVRELVVTPLIAVEFYWQAFWLDQPVIRAELAGRDLVCWCPLDLPCHADVLLDWANA